MLNAAPAPSRPGHVCGELVGGPLDGQLLDVTARTPEERSPDGALLISDHDVRGPGGRSEHEPRVGDPDRRDWAGDTA
ncbi:hypothetical protein ACFUIV_26985 [Streptomyces anulatus]|uniref:hypothetical protein n=1 Tax=Streptomyces anulatus TaxID=1892 RepID=UPI00362B403D